MAAKKFPETLKKYCTILHSCAHKLVNDRADLCKHQSERGDIAVEPGDFITKVKQINSQSDLIWCRILLARLTSQSDPLPTSF